MAMQVGFGGAFTRAFAVYDTPRYGSSIHALRGHAVKRDETEPFTVLENRRNHDPQRGTSDIKRNG